MLPLCLLVRVPASCCSVFRGLRKDFQSFCSMSLGSRSEAVSDFLPCSPSQPALCPCLWCDWAAVFFYCRSDNVLGFFGADLWIQEVLQAFVSTILSVAPGVRGLSTSPQVALGFCSEERVLGGRQSSVLSPRESCHQMQACTTGKEPCLLLCGPRPSQACCVEGLEMGANSCLIRSALLYTSPTSLHLTLEDPFTF